MDWQTMPLSKRLLLLHPLPKHGMLNGNFKNSKTSNLQISNLQTCQFPACHKWAGQA